MDSGVRVTQEAKTEAVTERVGLIKYIPVFSPTGYRYAILSLVPFPKKYEMNIWNLVH